MNAGLRPVRRGPDAILRLACAALVAASLFVRPTPLRAGCAGRDLFPLIERMAPRRFAELTAEVAATPFAKGALFKVSRERGSPSYVFGLLHLADPRVVTFRPSVVEALRRSSRLAVETTETGARLTQAIRKDPAMMRAAMIAKGAGRPAALLGAEDFQALEALADSLGMKSADASELKAQVLALMLDRPTCAREAGPYADELIVRMARRANTKVIGLETMVEQLDGLGPLSEEAARALLVSTLRQAPFSEDILETTIRRYADEDLGALLVWMRSPELVPGVADSGTPPEFLDRLLDGRTARMARRARPLFERGGVFVAVGAAHLPGERGLLRLLEKEGFTIERVNEPR